MKKLLTFLIVILIIIGLIFLGKFIYKKNHQKEKAFSAIKGNIYKKAYTKTINTQNISNLEISGNFIYINLTTDNTATLIVTYYSKEKNNSFFEINNSTLKINNKGVIIKKITGSISQNTILDLFGKQGVVTLDSMKNKQISIQINELSLDMKNSNVERLQLFSNEMDANFDNVNAKQFVFNISNSQIKLINCHIQNLNGKGQMVFANMDNNSFEKIFFTLEHGLLNINKNHVDNMELNINNFKIFATHCVFKRGILKGTKNYIKIDNNEEDNLKLQIDNSIIYSNIPIKKRVNLTNNIIYFIPSNKN